MKLNRNNFTTFYYASGSVKPKSYTFDSENRLTINGCSLFVTFKMGNDSWTEPYNLGEYIKQENAGIVRLSSNGQYLFYNDINGDNYWVSNDIIDDLKNDISRSYGV